MVQFKPVFEITYVNPELMQSLFFFTIGIVVTFFILRSFPKPLSNRIISFVWIVGWNAYCVLGVAGAFKATHHYCQKLRAGAAEVIEGQVEVLHRQPVTGHDAGDRIRINGKEFTYSFFSGKVTYHQTISHGGKLDNGVYARLYAYKGEILKAEVR